MPLGGDWTVPEFSLALAVTGLIGGEMGVVRETQDNRLLHTNCQIIAWKTMLFLRFLVCSCSSGKVNASLMTRWLRRPPLSLCLALGSRAVFAAFSWPGLKVQAADATHPVAQVACHSRTLSTVLLISRRESPQGESAETRAT